MSYYLGLIVRINPSHLPIASKVRLLTLMACALVLVVCVFPSANSASAATSVLFADYGIAYSSNLTPTVISTLQSSGFTTMVLFNMHIDTNGNFWFPDAAGTLHEICDNGKYVGPSAWPRQLVECLSGQNGMYRVEMCIGGWGDTSFTNIKNIIASQGVNRSNVLYRNLSALHGTLPISAICYDDESTYDSNSAILFGGMAGSLGMFVTLCPYTNQSYWHRVASGLSCCDYCYLQTYDGGDGQDPANWAAALGGSTTGSHGIIVMPLYWDNDRDYSVYKSKMRAWGSEGCVGGGLYPVCYSCNPGGILAEFSQYASLIHSSLDFRNNGQQVNVVNRHSGQVLAVLNNGVGLSSKIIQYPQEYGGMQGAEQNEIFTVINNNGNVQLIETLSGLAIQIPGWSSTLNQQCDLWYYIPGFRSQTFSINSQGNGFYSFVFEHDNDAMQVVYNSSDIGAPIVQYTLGANGNNALWMLRAPENASP